MAFWDQIEADYNAVIASADSVAVKLENLMGIQTRAQQMTALTTQFTTIIDDGSKATPEKVTELLTLVGKL
jgi:hypothetical protein